ncbi:threonine-phosphate decarboxylase CobD [Ralstonia pseudosolanacearum]|uniref:threonine-phosphate decarboxylase CobD n=1 Tax=Ralstonia pseudosolanacearum TaxID=1310165 RepID=UPI0026744215|nr:threonine-phosphate decarboxylase CobD [Ralstonia pseudosolanacearum]MDO3505547.1 threonine-phosphate decarboxylase CobD [Ralstonia pseudosolanacearum]MDO3511493.1 threonine-phosphate decarboxylase CobD [Ralstonia pseudosolanacearum]MDO3535240.1 threonine-phosphate decarboxylase CobD [Ralstonia pseudosolanacearum]MDO3608897.1 threonine-phosphate decarboxylase CobD [Ralstonia pseudosolanacearum]MDO3609768.1 threonine-phosphate decarboxylase CobD [Ralstonia pseudosolanacearum]
MSAAPRFTIAHGGNLAAARARHGEPSGGWVDLSTGINPHGYPVPPIPPEAWLRLPEDDGLEAAAASHYGVASADAVLAVAGSQAAIRALPLLLPRGRVGIARIGYSEYAPAFARAGHDVVLLDERDFLDATLPDALTHLVVVNPNNPTARCLPAATLRDWHARLSARGGTLIVDEAFIETLDAPPSLAPLAGAPGLVVLRSIGKFYGLAGARIGFVLGPPACLAALREALGHWTVNGPARAVVRAALADTAWQSATRARLRAEGARLSARLARHGLPNASTPLFAWVPTPDAAALHAALARQGLWTRLFDVPGTPPVQGLRLGLPPDAFGWQRLDDALASLPLSAETTSR